MFMNHIMKSNLYNWYLFSLSVKHIKLHICDAVRLLRYVWYGKMYVVQQDFMCVTTRLHVCVCAATRLHVCDCCNNIACLSHCSNKIAYLWLLQQYCMFVILQQQDCMSVTAATVLHVCHTAATRLHVCDCCNKDCIRLCCSKIACLALGQNKITSFDCSATGKHLFANAGIKLYLGVHWSFSHIFCNYQLYDFAWFGYMYF